MSDYKLLYPAIGCKNLGGKKSLVTELANQMPRFPVTQFPLHLCLRYGGATSGVLHPSPKNIVGLFSITKEWR
jgi:hypothetical protein